MEDTPPENDQDEVQTGDSEPETEAENSQGPEEVTPVAPVQDQTATEPADTLPEAPQVEEQLGRTSAQQEQDAARQKEELDSQREEHNARTASGGAKLPQPGVREDQVESD